MQGHDPSPLIFVVDDDTSIVRTLEGLLGRAGFRTAAAGSVAGALRGISEQHPDLILLDVHLPDGTGFDICSSVHDEVKTSSTPILFISAADDTSTKIRGFEAGGVDYITKPIVGAEVIARVRTHLRLKRAYDRIAELQAGHVGQLASAQKTLMASPEDFPEACFAVSIRQVLSAGGDFYDVIATGEDIADYLVADASGHDLGASLWTASLKALAAEYAGPMHLPSRLCAPSITASAAFCLREHFSLLCMRGSTAGRAASRLSTPVIRRPLWSGSMPANRSSCGRRAMWWAPSRTHSSGSPR